MNTKAADGNGERVLHPTPDSAILSATGISKLTCFDGVRFFPLIAHNDERGWLIELFRQDEIPVENFPVMAYVSQTMPGEARGPHEHVEQSDFFAFVGPGDFQLYLWDNRDGSPTFEEKLVIVAGESNPQSVIIPPGVVHAYRNISSHPGWVFNAPNRLYAGHGKCGPVDEIRHEKSDDRRFMLDDFVQT